MANAPISAARNHLVEDNIGLVHSCAHRFRGRGMEYDDLFQAGCMGLVKAAGAFDPERGFRFSTYAVPVILGEMRRLFRDGGTVKVSRSIKELGVRIARETERLQAVTGREPTVQELVASLGVSADSIIEAIGASQAALSLTGADEEGGGQFDIPVESHEEVVADLLSLREVLGLLERQDRELIYYRYFKNETQTETAKKLGMTQVQVSRREKKILLSLKKSLSA